MTEDELPEQLTVAELLARHGGGIVGRPRHRRAAPEPADAVDSLPIAEPAAEHPGFELESRSGQPKPTTEPEAKSELASEPEPLAELEEKPELATESEPAAEPGPKPDPAAELQTVTEPEPALDAAQPHRRSKRHGGIRALIVVGVIAVLIVAYYVVILLVSRSQVTRADVLHPDSADVVDAAAQQNVDNYLIVIGDRSGANAGAQITALAHVSADGSKLVIVSFPRQTIVDVPPCGTKGSPVEPFTGTLEAAFAKGGSRCSIAAVQEATGIRINHYVGIDLQRFGQVVDAVGGIKLCLRQPLKDPQLNLSIPAGQVTLNGTKATDYVRAVNRNSGDDPQRANRQVDFLAKLFDKVLSAQTVLNPVRMTQFALATADALTLDPDTTLGQLRSLGELFGGGSAKVSIVVPPMSATTLKVPGSSLKGARIDDVTGRSLFDSIIAGQQLPSVAVDPATNDSTQSASSASSAAATSQEPSKTAPSPAVC